MPRGSSDAIISIRPEYAEAILRGEKAVELRRRVPAISSGTRLWIYATLPVGAVVGNAVVRQIDRGSPSRIWRQWREHTGVKHARYKEYFAGTDEAVALVLSKVKRVAPISIDELRRRWNGFHPPQVMTRLSDAETKSLISLGKLAA